MPALPGRGQKIVLAQLASELHVEECAPVQCARTQPQNVLARGVRACILMLVQAGVCAGRGKLCMYHNAAIENRAGAGANAQRLPWTNVLP